MTAKQTAAARALAQSDQDLSAYDDSILHGCGLPDFRQVVTSLGAVARTMRYQCATFAGGWDEVEFQSLVSIFRRKVICPDA